MTALTALRKGLAASLGEALAEDARTTCHDHVPEELTGRDVIVTYAPDALLPSETYDPREFVAALEVFVLVGGEANAEVHDAISDLLPPVLASLHAGEWQVRGTSRLVSYETDAWASYGVSVTVRKHLII